MRLGFLTSCLPGEPLSAIAEWAGRAGFSALEVAAWPREEGGARGPCHLDVTALDDAGARRLRALLDDHGLTISAIGFYENNLDADPGRRAATHRHLRRCIEAAARLECGLVGTFVGRDVRVAVAEDLRQAERVLPPLVREAERAGVRLVVENCPMEGWHPDGYPGNLAYSPELWEWLAGLGLYLNYDPSHLVWLGIDPVNALRAHRSLILHVQAKDTQVDPAARDRYGVYGRVVERRGPWDAGWWRYRVPGLGEVDWPGVVGLLRASGYDGVVSIEHEDPVLSGSPGRVREGLLRGAATLRPLLGGS